MRALLVLFMVDTAKGGMGLSDQVATAIYGLYTAGAYLSALPGGWLADRVLGARKAVWYGGIIIAAGHFTLAIPSNTAFYLGLVLIVAGTGLLKPNISALVGQLYPEGGARRDAGFTIFYMGINIGAALGPLVCSTLGEKQNWHAGFAAAGVGMVLGLIQYRLTDAHLGQAGLTPGNATALTGAQRTAMILGGGAAIPLLVLLFTGVIPIDPVVLARRSAVVIVTVGVLYFATLFAFAGLDRTEKKRVGMIIVLFLGSALFWAGFEQAGSSLNLFAERHTLRTLGNFEIPAGWFQSLNAVFIITLAPLVAWVWVALASRGREPSIPAKFAWALVFLAAGFAVISAGSRVAAAGGKAWPTWLMTTYLLHTIGELCLSPVGLSSVTKLAPQRLVGQMMGTWFLATSLGNLLAGLIAGEFHPDRIDQMPAQFMKMVWLPIGTAVLLFLLVKPLRKWTAGVN